MKQILSIVINPTPDADGFHILHCPKCEYYFMKNPSLDDTKQKPFYCPYCGHEGDYPTFIQSITSRLLPSHIQLNENELQDDLIEEPKEMLNEEEIQDLIEQMTHQIKEEDIETEVIEYSIDDVYHNPMFTSFEMICCERDIKVPIENQKKVKFCTFCKGEITQYE